MLTQKPISRAERLLTRETVLAGAVAEPRIDDDIVADREASRRTADGVNHAACVGAERPRRNDGDAGQSAQREEIEMIQSRGSHAHTNIGIVAQRRHGEVIAQLESIEAAVTRDGKCTH